MLYKIIPNQPIAAVIDAESAEIAMDGFAFAMDSDMNTYFTAIPATENEAAEYGILK